MNPRVTIRVDYEFLDLATEMAADCMDPKGPLPQHIGGHYGENIAGERLIAWRTKDGGVAIKQQREKKPRSK